MAELNDDDYTLAIEEQPLIGGGAGTPYCFYRNDPVISK